jgi:hypothetical protein
MKRLIVHSLLFIVFGFLFWASAEAQNGANEVNYVDFYNLITSQWLEDVNVNDADFGDFAVFGESWGACKNCPCCLYYMSPYIHVQMTCELDDPPVVYTGSPELQSDGFYYGYLHTASGAYTVVGVQFCWDWMGNGQSETYGWGYVNLVNTTCECTGMDFGKQYPHCLFDLDKLVVDELPAPFTLYCEYVISLFKINEY